VARGGRRLLRARLNLRDAGLTEEQWRQRWEAARLFIRADREKGAHLGNQTLRWNPDEGWFEVRLPTPLAHLANRPHDRCRLSCPVEFKHRSDEVAAQADGGSVYYDIRYDPVKDRWHLDAAWKTGPRPAPPLDELRASPLIAVDVNAGHLAVAVVTPDGNVTGEPFTIPLQLAGLPAATRDGRIRAAVTRLIATAKAAGRGPSSSRTSTSWMPAPRAASAPGVGLRGESAAAPSGALSRTFPPRGSATAWSR